MSDSFHFRYRACKELEDGCDTHISDMCANAGFLFDLHRKYV